MTALIAALLLCACAQPEKSYKVARCTHAIGLCNLAMFVAKEDQTASADNVTIELVQVPGPPGRPRRRNC